MVCWLMVKPSPTLSVSFHCAVKVEDSRPARSAGRVKKVAFKPLKFLVCYEGSILLFKVLKIHPVMLAHKFTSSENTHDANFSENMANTSF